MGLCGARFCFYGRAPGRARWAGYSHAEPAHRESRDGKPQAFAASAPLGFVLRTNRRGNGLCPISHGHFAAGRKMRAGAGFAGKEPAQRAMPGARLKKINARAARFIFPFCSAKLCKAGCVSSRRWPVLASRALSRLLRSREVPQTLAFSGAQGTLFFSCKRDSSRCAR